MKKTIAIVLIMTIIMTLLMSLICFADVDAEAKAIKEVITKLLKELGITVVIIMVSWIGFKMLFGGGGGTDLSRYKIQAAGLLIGVILSTIIHYQN